MTMTENELKDGKVVGIAGPVIDVEFPRGSLPEINTALEFTVTVDGKSEHGPEGNYRQRLYRFRSLMTQRHASPGRNVTPRTTR